MWLLTTENLHPAFQKNAGRKSPTEPGMCQGRRGARVYHMVVPVTLTMLVQQHHRRADLQGVEKRFRPFGMLSWAFVCLPL